VTVLYAVVHRFLQEHYAHKWCCTHHSGFVHGSHVCSEALGQSKGSEKTQNASAFWTYCGLYTVLSHQLLLVWKESIAE